jgi:hypothetical protein
MSSFQQQKTQDDMIDIQDKIGYVDTGPIPQQQQQQQQQQTMKNTVVSSSTSHLTIKEPKPQSQVHILWNKHHQTKPPEIQQESKVSFHSTTKPIIKKSNSIEHISSSSYTLNPLNVSQQQRTMKGKERQPSAIQDTASSSPPLAYITQNRDEIKDMMVSKLYELADMLKSLNIDEQRSSQVAPPPPKLTPSRSDPAYNHHYYQYQPVLRRKPSKPRYIPPHPPQYTSPPDHQHRLSYNKSADHAMNYQEPTTVHNHRSSSTYPTTNTTRYTNDGYYNPPYYPPPQPEEDPYDNYYYHPEDPYDRENTPIDYYMIPPPPPPQQYYERPRRKSFGHFHEGSSLQRKGSRSNLRRSRQPVMFDARYESYPYPPAYYPHQYSPNGSYYP